VKTGSLFRTHLNEQTKKALTKMWKDCDMETNVIVLEQAKSEYVVENAWRPTNKSVEEQIEPHLRRMLEKKRKYLETQVEFQKQQIAVS
jgi:flagellar biosynthesis component FlhA